MSATTVLLAGVPTTPAISTVDGQSIESLARSLGPVCDTAVDVDEVAAYLEAGGINDRTAAREYGQPSVFALAAQLLRHGRGAAAATASAASAADDSAGTGVAAATLVRAGLYLTPAVVAVGAAEHLVGLPVLAGVGTLIFGWATAQALAFLGYCVLGSADTPTAARVLALGFGFAAVIWLGVLYAAGTRDPWAVAVAAGQLTLFAATAVALVTGTERRTLAAATITWVASAGFAVAADGQVAVPAAILALGLAAMLALAYQPAFRAKSGRRWRPRLAQCHHALVHGAVGAGQAVLFAAVLLVGSEPSRLPIAAVPLLAGVPVAELTLVWHQRRVAAVRAKLCDRVAYQRRLNSVSLGTLAVLSMPVALGAACTVSGAGRLGASMLLTAGYALCLVLVAHRRLGLAALLVWWPALLIGVLYRCLPAIGPGLVETLVATVLFAVCLPALVVVAMVLRDRWSYR
jgi:hypothetical protein